MHKVCNLFRCLSTSDEHTFLKAYKIYVRPVLEYGTPVFSPLKMKDIDALERVQNSFTRKLFLRSRKCSYRSIPDSSERRRALGLESLFSRRKKFDLLMVFKIMHGLVHLGGGSFFTVRSSITRGAAVKLHYPRARASVRANFFVCRAGAEYAKLSKRFRIPANLAGFKKMVAKSFECYS